MTRDEILKLEAGKELDALVATEVMGWHGGNPSWITQEGKCTGWLSRFETDSLAEEFNPSTDISAAWQVVEKMKEKYWMAINTSMSSLQETEWGVEWSKNGVIEKVDFVLAPTAPLAICRAALLAMEAK